MITQRLNRSHYNNKENWRSIIGIDSNCKKQISPNFMPVDNAFFFLGY